MNDMNNNDICLGKLVDDSEQLSLAIKMLGNQDMEPDVFKAAVLPLSEVLHSKLEDISHLVLLQNQLRKVS